MKTKRKITLKEAIKNLRLHPFTKHGIDKAGLVVVAYRPAAIKGFPKPHVVHSVVSHIDQRRENTEACLYIDCTGAVVNESEIIELYLIEPTSQDIKRRSILVKIKNDRSL